MTPSQLGTITVPAVLPVRARTTTPAEPMRSDQVAGLDSVQVGRQVLENDAGVSVCSTAVTVVAATAKGPM